jgi:hypothetical protein
MDAVNKAKQFYKDKTKQENVGEYTVTSIKARDANHIYTLIGDLEYIDGVKNQGGKSAGQSFCGTTYEEWIAEIEKPSITLNNIKREREKIEKSGIENTLKEIIRECVHVRKRRNSEHDGEWSLDRKWELKPFMRTDKDTGEAPSLVIRCMGGFNGMTKAEQITEYASKACALSDIIESIGIKTRLSIIHDNQGRFSKTRDEITYKNRFEYLIKDFDEYGSLDAMATCFHASTQRRTMFALYALVAATNKWVLTDRLGKSIEHPIINDNPGEITLSINNLDSIIRGDTSEIKKLMNALKTQSWQ